jgi:hypothetical protein
MRLPRRHKIYSFGNVHLERVLILVILLSRNTNSVNSGIYILDKFYML